jgi:hypothetical protein
MAAPPAAWQAEVIQLVLQQPGLAAGCGDLLDAIVRLKIHNA